MTTCHFAPEDERHNSFCEVLVDAGEGDRFDAQSGFFADLAAYPALGRIIFGEYALAWLDSRAHLKPKTRHQYESLLRLHILPTWRAVPLAKVTFEGLTQWVARLTLGGLGASGVRQSVFVVSAALDHAVRSGRLRANPARGLGLPRPGRRDYVYLTHRQVLDLATAAGPWRLLILVLAYTGLRWGEATALRV